MNKKILAGAAVLALAAPVLAQSTVTVYGVVDLDGEVLSGHTKDVLLTSGGLAGSRLGFKGSEDLGGGNFADFVLEGGLNVDTGGSAQGGQLFGRQAFGALRGPWGTLSAGRQYSTIYVATGEFSAFGNTSVGATTAVIGGFAGGYEPVRGGANVAAPTTATGSSVNGGPARVNNSVRYTSPAIAGFRFSGLAGVGEVAGHVHDDRLLDGSVRFTDASLGLDALVSVVDDKVAPAGLNSGANVRTITAAAIYAFSDFHVEGGYLGVDDRRPANLDGKGFWLGGDWRVGSNLFKAQWVQNKPEHTTVGKTNAYGLGYQFDFSKRTAIYADLTRFTNGGTGLGRAEAAIPAGLTVAGDTSLSEVAIGVRHAF
jgi:predicted porin